MTSRELYFRLLRFVLPYRWVFALSILGTVLVARDKYVAARQVTDEVKQLYGEAKTAYAESTAEDPPRVSILEGAGIPQPYRDLLVHRRDMTSTLERFWASPICRTNREESCSRGNRSKRRCRAWCPLR